MNKAAAASPKQQENAETQPIDIMSAPTPTAIETVISPDHSAERKRITYQSKGQANQQADTTTPPQAMPADTTKPPSKDEKKREEFTESDNEAG